MNILLLAGTSEARAIAKALVIERRLNVVASLAGATRDPDTLGCTTRIGGFGGTGGFTRYMHDHKIDAVIDATHPFAARMSQTAADVCAKLGVNHIQVMRPAWTAGPGDKWCHVNEETEIGTMIPNGAVVFLATGRQTLDRFTGLQGCELICRVIDPPAKPFPFANGYFLQGRPPFSVGAEKNLFAQLGIDWLVVKNSGGAASRSKLDAARHLDLPVILINRPPQPDCTQVATANEAILWAKSLRK